MTDNQTDLDKEFKSKEDKENTSETERERDELDDLFDDFVSKQSLFNDKDVLSLRHVPNTIPHRQKQIKKLGMILAPALRNDRPSNIFIYGKTGTGKTLCTLHTLNRIVERVKDSDVNLTFAYLNCKLKKVADTEYRIIAALAKNLGEKVPATGLPTDEVYNIFLKKLDETEQVVILVLDEIDRLVQKTGDEILYTLTRINSELKRAKLCLIGISNDVRFIENIDPRVKSSLGEEELIFPPYNALELKDILSERSELAFVKDVINSGVLAKCAAYAAKEHGDARRALDLLRVAGEVAERAASDSVEMEHIREAEDKIEKNRILELVKTLPNQSKLLIYSIFFLNKQKHKLETGEIYEAYAELCKVNDTSILTQRRISDLISELDMLGLINARVISKGRHGRTREIYSTIPSDLTEIMSSELRVELML